MVVGLSLSAATSASAASVTTSQVLGWGLDASGQVGDGTTVKRRIKPTGVLDVGGATAISAGGGHSLALISAGTAMAWGGNGSGQLGNGTTTDSATPVFVCAVGTEGPCPSGPYLGNVTSIAGGSGYSLALLSNGTVMAWGANDAGELGNGTNTDSDVPVPVCAVGTEGPCPAGPYLSEVAAVSAGQTHSLALLRNGTVVTWGGNFFPPLIDNPVEVSGLSEVTAISASVEHSLALLSDGEVMAWGGNFAGQLGNGTTTNSATPVRVCAVGTEGPCPSGPYLGNVTSISAGNYHNLALLNSGAVAAWGMNKNGQLGDGSTTWSTTPVAVSGASGVTAVSAGGQHSLALLSNGTAMSWGLNESGQLGIGSTTSSDVPLPVSGLSKLIGVSAGGSHSLAFRSPVPTVTKVKPASGSTEGGTAVTITGTNLTAATAVDFGATSAASVTVNSATSITAVSPAGSVGQVDVRVTTPVGTSAISSGDHFKYAPTVTGVSPNSGLTTGGAAVTITGAGFALGTTATAFRFGITKATSVNCTSTTTCTAVAPAHAAGIVDVTATVSKIVSPKTPPGDQFTYN
jgi:alpha-tubulin suppressor-like RCC1 family protein